MKKMTKAQAIDIVARFLKDHIIAGDLWCHEDYAEEVRALCRLRKVDCVCNDDKWIHDEGEYEITKMTV